MEIALYIVAALVLVLLVVVVLAALQPPTYRVQRSLAINAPAERVFGEVNDLHRWQSWSPWAKLDPNSVETHAGPPAGLGASMSWNGNNQVGAGTMTITESAPARRIDLSLDFRRPFKSVCAADFTFEPRGDQTLVTWGMGGKKIFVAKVMGLFCNMDKMIGTQFEQGLAQLKAVAESPV